MFGVWTGALDERRVAQAAGEVIQGKLKKAGGEGGLIALDARGQMAMPFNTQRMYRGYVTEDGQTFTALVGEDGASSPGTGR